MNRNSAKKLLRMVLQAMDDIPQIADDVYQKYSKEAKEYLDYIGRTAVDDFYSDYDPHIYNRQYDLYNAYRIHINTKRWEIVTDPGFMKKTHRVSNQYIFDWAFKFGYHGGAFDGPGHPNGVEPYYRTFPYYKTWSNPAVRAGFSPYLQIEEEATKYLDDTAVAMQKEYNDRANLILDNIIAQIKVTFS